jgi:hypothetical protein
MRFDACRRPCEPAVQLLGLAGATETSPEDLSFLADSLWREPTERAKVARLVGRLAGPIGSQALEIADAAREMAAKVKALHKDDRKAYLAQASQSLDGFRAQQEKLKELSRTAGQRAQQMVNDALTEVNQLLRRARPQHQPVHRIGSASPTRATSSCGARRSRSSRSCSVTPPSR